MTPSDATSAQTAAVIEAPSAVGDYAAAGADAATRLGPPSGSSQPPVAPDNSDTVRPGPRGGRAERVAGAAAATIDGKQTQTRT